MASVSQVSTGGFYWSLRFVRKLSFRKFQSETSSPTLLCIQDIEENVFGALISCPIKLWDHFYGTGETFLFTCQPQFQVFKWSGENPHFAR